VPNHHLKEGGDGAELTSVQNNKTCFVHTLLAPAGLLRGGPVWQPLEQGSNTSRCEVQC